MATDSAGHADAPAARLGYLLKHAWLRFEVVSAAALEPLGVTGRECAILGVINERTPLSQQEVAHRLGVDRTTMVSLIDVLEGKGLVRRAAHPDDRRKNVVTLTALGGKVLAASGPLRDSAEREFLAPLPPSAARAFRAALEKINASAE